MKHNIHQGKTRTHAEERQGNWQEANLEAVKDDEAFCLVATICRAGHVDVMRRWANSSIEILQRGVKPAAVDPQQSEQTPCSGHQQAGQAPGGLHHLYRL